MSGLIVVAGLEFYEDADRLHPRAGSGLPDHRRSAAARRDTGPDRGGRPTRHRYHSRDTKGVEHVAPFAGLDATTFTVASNTATIFSGLAVALQPRDAGRVTANTVLADLRKRLSVIKDAQCADHPAAAGSGPRQRRRLQDDAGGPCRARFRMRWSRRQTRSRRCGQQGSDLCRGVHAVQRRLAVGLRRYRPAESRESRTDADRRLFDAAGLSRLRSM